MNIKTLITAIFLFFCSQGFGQTELSIGPNLSTGNKSFPKGGKTGLGAGIEIIHNVYKSGAIRLSFSFDRFGRKNLSPDSILHSGHHGSTLTYLPLRAGFQQTFFTDNLNVYGEIGMFFLQSPSGYYFQPKKTGLTYALATGHKFQLKYNQVLRIWLIYNMNKLQLPFGKISENYATLRVAYGIQWHTNKHQ